ncbi:hypothetical protein D9M71_498520 [compost metagenome]
MEAVTVALLLRIAGRIEARGVRRAGQYSGTEGRAAPEAQVGAVGRTQAIDAVVTHLADQGQAIRAPHLVEELGGGHLRLQHRHAFVGGHGRTQHIAGEAGGVQRRCRVAERGVDEVRRRQLQRHVRPVADFAAQ